LLIQSSAGYPCDMFDIKKIAKENCLYVIEEEAYTIGSRYADPDKLQKYQIKIISGEGSEQ